MISPELIQNTKNHQNFSPKPHGLGDLAYVPDEIRTIVINKAVRDMRERRSTLDDLRMAEQATKLRNGLEVFAAYVQNPTNYPDRAKERVQLSIQQADAEASTANPIGRAASRLARFDGVHAVSDHDGTLSNLDQLVGVDKKNYLEVLIPGSEIAEAELWSNRENFPEMVASYWGPLLTLRDENGKIVRDLVGNMRPDQRGYEAFRLAGRSVPLREGVSEFFRFAKEKGMKRTVLSANFEPFVMGVVGRIPEADGTSVFAVTHNSIISTAKGNLLLHLAQQDPHNAIVYIGDGGSDLPALKVQDVIAFYFALEGGQFAEKLEDSNLLHFTYRNFYDITQKLQQIISVREPAPVRQPVAV